MKNRIVISLLAGTLALGACNLDEKSVHGQDKRRVKHIGCKRFTGSVIKHIDQLIYRYLTEWVVTGIMPENQLYGLESGYADWLVAPRYVNDFSSLVNGMRRQAILFEKEYYETSGY